MPDPATQLTPFFHVTVLQRSVAVLLDEAMRDAPLRPLEYAITSAIEDGDSVTASGLAREFAVPLTTVASWLTRMSERAYVERQPDPSDQRAQRLTLTAEGRRAHLLSREAFGRAYLAFLDRSDTPPEQLNQALSAMTEAVRAATEDVRRSDVEGVTGH